MSGYTLIMPVCLPICFHIHVYFILLICLEVFVDAVVSLKNRKSDIFSIIYTESWYFLSFIFSE